MDRLDPDLQCKDTCSYNPINLEFELLCYIALLRSLVTRGSQQRPTPGTLPSQPFFSSLPISTLNFLDRSNFSTKSREEKISFMKGLSNVLDRFSEGLRTRKILPTLLEEVSPSSLRQSNSSLKLNHFGLLDERRIPAPLHPSECILDRNCPLRHSIRIHGPPEPQASIYDQRSTSKHADATRESSHSTEQD